MSGHLIGCVKPITDLPTRSHKLALLAFADSGDDRTHIALPGYEGVQEWVGCGRSQAFALIQDLIALGYLRQHKRGHRGQRAEWIVFPNGCCDTHRTPVAEEPVDVDQLARAAGVDVEQARLLLTAMGHDAPPSKQASKPAENGSDPTGPYERGKGPALGPDPNDPASPETPQAGENAGDDGSDDHRQGPESIHGSRVTADAFTPSTTTPIAPEQADQPCKRHPNSEHPNCRGCGTTDRQKAERAAREAAERRRQRGAQEAAAARLEREQAARPPQDLRARVAAAAAEAGR